MKSADHVLETVRERRMSRANLTRLLNDLDTRDVVNGVTVYARPGYFHVPTLSYGHTSPSGRESKGESVTEAPGQFSPRLEKSETGGVVFLSETSRLAVLPPFPVERDQVLDGWDTSPLRALLNREYMLGVVLLRLGRFAVGVFRGEALLSSKTDTRYVKGRHSAGGQSQKRFERIREKQAQELFDKTCTVVKEKFTPYEDRLDYILLGGERFTLQGFLKRCDYLGRLSPKILGRRLNIREPKHVTLERGIETVWESLVLSFENTR